MILLVNLNYDSFSTKRNERKVDSDIYGQVITSRFINIVYPSQLVSDSSAAIKSLNYSYSGITY